TINDPGIRIEILQQPQPAAESPTDHPLFRAMESAGARVYPRATVAPFMSPAGTDSRFFRRRGIPAYGIFPALIPRHVPAPPHGTDGPFPAHSPAPGVPFTYEALGVLCPRSETTRLLWGADPSSPTPQPPPAAPTSRPRCFSPGSTIPPVPASSGVA